MNKKFTVELNCLDFLLAILGWNSPQCRKAFMAEIAQFQDCTVNLLKVSEKDALLVRFSTKSTIILKLILFSQGKAAN